MSEQTFQEPVLEPMAQSKVKLVRNAKGHAQWEITVVEGFDPVELERIRDAAIAQHVALVQSFGDIS
jgi:hypothetical protein